MKKKKLVSLIITIAMVMTVFVSNVSVVNAASFKDVNGDEFYAEAAQELSMRGLLSGYDDGEFKPERTITRAEMAKLVCALKGDYAMQDAETMVYYEFELPFWDVDPNHWAMPYILYANVFEIINGYNDGTFKPEAPVTYEEAVKMIICAIGFDHMVFNYPEDWAKGYLEIAEHFGITKDCFCQRGQFANRGHVAVIMYNAVRGIDFGFSYVGGVETDGYYEDNYYEDEFYEDEFYEDEFYEDDYYEDDYYEDESYEEEYYGTRGPGEYLLTFEKSDMGVIYADAGYYKPGDKITIKALGDEDHRFMSWSSDNGGEFYNVFKYETTFTMPANDVVIEASYIADYGKGSEESDDSDALDKYDGQNINLNKYVRLNMRMVGCGSYRDLSGPYHPGQVVELKIGPGDEDIFLGWSSDDVDLPTPSSPKCKIVIPDHDVTVTATFKD